MKALDQLIEPGSNLGGSPVDQWKAGGRKVLGFFCAYIPEELIAAAGALPYRVRPAGCTQAPLADSMMSSYNCTFARSCLEYALRGKFEFMDGVVSMNSCDHIRRLYDIWKEKVPAQYMHFMSVPHKASPDGIVWYRRELEQFKVSLEEWLQAPVEDAEIRKAIQVQNETRRLLRRLYDLRKAANPPVTGTQVQQILLSASAMPKEQYNALLSDFLNEVAGAPPVSGHKARLMIIGSMCDSVEFTQLLENAGGLVVTDALCFGSRYFWEPVEEGGDDLLMNLATSYLKRPACARMSDELPKRMAFVEGLAREYRVDGIIYEKMRYCDLWAGEGLQLSKLTPEWGIPVLSLDREYWMTGAAGLRLRIEAFLENLGKET
ncbi:MAG: 2-hydroxyacyl-CoA dehydratase family protein [Dehalococcoidia bacterium]|nr:2-hydroxyacyl-CoA dehydratase family protein [Dehalococcoidia bacterium]